MTKGIYCYIDKQNNQIIYIGKDSNIDKNKRYRDHFTPSCYNKQQINKVLQNNPDRYIYQVLWEIEDCTDNHLNQMEIYYIREYDPRFNFTKGGDGISGFQHSVETRRKMSKNHPDVSGKNNPMYNKKHTEESRRKISKKLSGANNSMYNKKHSEKTKRKIGAKHKGKKYSKETRQKMSKRHNTTGFYRVSKKRDSNYKQGFIWIYQYYDNNKRKAIYSVDLKKLEKKVRKEGLEWKIIDKENSIKSMQENNNCF